MTEALLQKQLNVAYARPFGAGGGGCISAGHGYDTDIGKIFVKENRKDGARLMFDGEEASLAAISKTNTVRVPKPMKVIDNPKGGAYLVMEYVDMKGLGRSAGKLGEQLARLHLHNIELLKQKDRQAASVHSQDPDSGVTQFGFHTATCCGFIPQDNTWEDDWVTFYTRHKLQLQLDMIEKEYRDREARDLWSQLLPKIPNFFKNIEIAPSLQHGDLWGGNAAETSEGPVIFDAASFYGHHEYDLGIATMFGGFGNEFFKAYHRLIPKASGFDTRNDLYQLFHYLNHWNHFGTGYRGQSVSIMKSLLAQKT